MFYVFIFDWSPDSCTVTTEKQSYMETTKYQKDTMLQRIFVVGVTPNIRL